MWRQQSIYIAGGELKQIISQSFEQEGPAAAPTRMFQVPQSFYSRALPELWGNSSDLLSRKWTTSCELELCDEWLTDWLTDWLNEWKWAFATLAEYKPKCGKAHPQGFTQRKTAHFFVKKLCDTWKIRIEYCTQKNAYEFFYWMSKYLQIHYQENEQVFVCVAPILYRSQHPIFRMCKYE
jgi:hypothetical protein